MRCAAHQEAWELMEKNKFMNIPPLRLTIAAGIRISGIRHLGILGGHLFHSFRSGVALLRSDIRYAHNTAVKLNKLDVHASFSTVLSILNAFKDR